MKIKLTLKNYRCFRAEQPAVFEIGDGFTGFIGPNNAGKSSILKFFYEIRVALNHARGLRNFANVNGMLGRPATGIGGLPSPITDPQEIVYENATTPLEFEIHIETDETAPSRYVKTATWSFSSLQQTWSVNFITSDGVQLRHGSGNDNVTGVDSQFVHMNDGSSVSIDDMLAALDALSNVQYLGPFRNAVNEGAGEYYDLRLGTSFLQQWHQWKTGGSKQQNRAIDEVTEDIRRLIGAKKLEINASMELKTLQVSIDGRPHKLSELGAGIAQLIVVLGNAMIRRPSFIAIDEPETHLHPGLQLDFFTTLASYATRGVIYATHSIGLARSTADRLYSVQTTEKGSIVRLYEKTANYAEFLGSIGIAGLQDIGWDKVLLVEGATDVRVFQQFLKKYGKERQVVILPLGGGSMINGSSASQLEEIVRLGGKVFAIVDSEKKAANEQPSKGHIEFAKICQQLKINCHITERRATENYFTKKSLDSTFGEKYAELGQYETPSAAKPFWGKSENWRCAKELSLEELNATDLGKFLSTL